MNDSAAEGPRVVAGTIVSGNYLPAARVLTESYLRAHPGASVRVLVLDATSAELAGRPGWPAAELAELGDAQLVGYDQLDLAPGDYHRMAAAYVVTEFATALKPWLLRLMLTQGSVAMFLDPDIEVFAPFAAEVGELAAEHGIVLTPHVTEPMPRDGLHPSEAHIMASGVFNLGFAAVSAAGTPFLDFWAERLRQDALVAPSEQLFTDQRWVDNVPALFHHTVIADPGFNVAYWNVYQRPVLRTGTADDPQWTAAGKPLRFFHFSGFRPEKPWLLSTHWPEKPRVLLSEEPVLAQLCAAYRDKMIAAGYGDTLESIPYGWATLPDGTPLSQAMRRTFRDAWITAERTGKPLPPSPFAPEGAAAFLAWAAQPANAAQRAAGSNRWAMAVWTAREDLRKAFPDPLGEDVTAYRAWCETSGVAEKELPASLVPGPDRRAAVTVRDEPGVNLLGYFSAELGVGEMGRLLLAAAAAADLPVATVVEESTVSNRTGHPVPVGPTRSPRFPVSVLCVNADMTEQTIALHRGLVADRYVIGLWSWELSVFPASMRAAFEHVDEVWTISDFCRDAIAADAPVPVRTFPVPVRDPFADGVTPAREARDHTGFLFAFDYNSVFARKNPLAVVEAFRAAFGERDDVRLVLKSINGDKHPGDRERLRMAVAGDPRIELIERYLSAAEVGELFAAADCYVSLHRSEGFGLTVAEAMARGLPVIATDYSGSAEVLTAETGWPIESTLVTVGPGNAPYPVDARWARPDVAQAAAAMRAVAEDPAAAREKGAKAREHVLATRSTAAAGAWVAARVGEARQRWQQRAVSKPVAAGAGVLDALPAAREALRWRPDVSTPSKLPFAPAMRRAVLRAIDHYDFHQRNVVGSVLDAVETSLVRLESRLDEVDRRAEAARAQATSALAEDIDGVRADVAAQGAQLRALAEERSASADRETTLAATIDALTARLSIVERTATATAAGRDELDAKLMTLLHERDQRIDAATVSGLESARRVRALTATVAAHHELLDTAPAELATEVVATDVGALRLPADDTVMLPWLRHYACWEPEEAALVDRLLAPGDTFVDIGAHVGYFSLRALRRVGRDGAVFAVEPWAPARTLLEHNVRANLPAAFRAGLTVLPAAAWDTDEGLRLRWAEPGNSGDHRVSDQDNDPAGADTELVPGIRLAGVAELAARRVRMVKCDAQGQDHRALTGLLDVLRRDTPDVLCEFWPDAITEAGGDPVEVVERYAGWGYEVLPVTAKLVGEVQSGTTGSGRRPTARGLVKLAREAEPGFVTLWLRPKAGDKAADKAADQASDKVGDVAAGQAAKVSERTTGEQRAGDRRRRRPSGAGE